MATVPETGRFTIVDNDASHYRFRLFSESEPTTPIETITLEIDPIGREKAFIIGAVIMGWQINGIAAREL
jgi:hypothetical protein